jgi:DNA-3-methyladenine glycosylase
MKNEEISDSQANQKFRKDNSSDINSKIPKGIFTCNSSFFIINSSFKKKGRDFLEKLPREFYNRDSVTVAKDLLGKNLVHVVEGEKLIGKIVEVEAYMGPDDKAAHSYNNRRTERNEIMYGGPGFSYVYIIYGMYNCMNVVVEQPGKPQAILIRALEPVEGLESMSRYRYGKNYEELSRRERLGLTSGPGKLCMALNIDRSHNGLDLCEDRLYITRDDKEQIFEIVSTTRINIDYAEEAKDFPWRFYIEDNPFVSKK